MMTAPRTLRLLLCAVLMLAFARTASANTISYNLDDDHCTGSCGSAGTIFGVVTLAENGANVDITVDLNDPYLWAKTGALNHMMFEFNGNGVALGDISVDQTWAGETLAAMAGPLTGGPAGTFAWGIKCTTCGNGLSDAGVPPAVVLKFHIANAIIADLIVPNDHAHKHIFAADIGSKGGAWGGNGNTGVVAATTPNITRVPDGGMTLSLLGMAMAGMGLVARRFKN